MADNRDMKLMQEVQDKVEVYKAKIKKELYDISVEYGKPYDIFQESKTSHDKEDLEFKVNCNLERLATKAYKGRLTLHGYEGEGEKARPLSSLLSFLGISRLKSVDALDLRLHKTNEQLRIVDKLLNALTSTTSIVEKKEEMRAILSIVPDIENNKSFLKIRDTIDKLDAPRPSSSMRK